MKSLWFLILFVPFGLQAQDQELWLRSIRNVSTQVQPTRFIISVTEPAGCTIFPNGNVTVDTNLTQVFTVAANDGYTLDSLYVDGSKVTPATGYTFTGVKANHTLQGYVHVTPGGPLTIFYASPTGLSTNVGSRANPWDITKALSACSKDTTVVLLGGIYIQDSTDEWTMGGNGRSRMIADIGAVPVFTRRNGAPPRVYPADSTTLQGIWFGGTVTSDSVGDALGHGSVVVPGNYDSLVACVFFNGYKFGVVYGDQTGIVTRNCLLVNLGNVSNGLYHALYISNSSNTAAGMHYVQRNVFLSSPYPGRVVQDAGFPLHSSQGYAIHVYHDPKYITVEKNLTSYALGNAFQGSYHYVRDNVFWRGYYPAGAYEIEDPVTTPVDTAHIWRHNVWVQGDTANLYPFTVFPDTADYADAVRYDGDSAFVRVNAFNMNYPNKGMRQFGTVKPTRIYSADSIATMFGYTEAEVDAVRESLGGLFLNKTVTEVYAEREVIWTGFQKLLGVVDAWQGTSEEEVRPDIKPEVVTGAATSVWATSFQLNARILPCGLETRGGFVWGTSSGSYTDSVTVDTVTGTWRNSSWSHIQAGLSYPQTYYIRAWASNALGYTRGSEVTVATDSLVPPTYDSTSSNYNYTTNVSTWTHVFGSASGRLATLGAGCNSNTTRIDSAVIVTSAGVRYKMTLVDSASGEDDFFLSAWKYVNPPAGVDTVKVYWNSATGYKVASMSSWTGATDVNYSGHATGSAAHITATITSTLNSRCVAWLYGGNHDYGVSPITDDAGQSRVTYQHPYDDYYMLSAKTTSGATSVTMGWTKSSSYRSRVAVLSVY